MDLFDKIGKKASQTYHATKEKASNISEELKLKGKISETKEEIKKIYTEIGEKVYNELKDGRDVSRDEINVKCEEISRLKDKISKLEDDILAVKKIKKCTNCGTSLDIDADFCSKCGKEQPKNEKVEIKSEPSEESKDAEVIDINNTNNNEENNGENQNNNNND